MGATNRPLKGSANVTDASIPELHPLDPSATKQSFADSVARWRLRTGQGSCMLYRFYDAERALLYIGKTYGTTPLDRWKGHRTDAAWWPLVAFASVDRIGDNYTELGALEKAAIRSEQPRFNKQHKRSRSSFMVFTRQGPGPVIEQFRELLLPEDFAALVAAFHALPSTEES